jgi:anti-anti-sigma factor
MRMTSFSATRRYVNGGVVHLDLAGEVRGAADANDLAMLIFDALMLDFADELIIDLDAVGFLDAAGVGALVCGYEAAVECRVVYRVVHAREQPRQALLATGMLEVLADSQDIGAVLLALVTLPDPKLPDGRLTVLPAKDQRP